MNTKTKTFFSFLAKKEIILFLSIFIFWGIFIPIHSAYAVWDWLIGAITFVPSLAIALIFLMIALITALLPAFSGMVLTYVTSSNFTTLSYTDPARNKLIEVGLGITQGFVNMLLVLVLVFIALATILRLSGYETKKLLITFIGIALLVNFSPVICGLIVDASNIVMNFFLKEFTGMKALSNSFGSILDSLKNFNWKESYNVTTQAGLLVQLGVLSVINLILFLILLLFAMIFLARYIFIWILVILSPLAFACYVLPATKKYWTLWWTQFIQWSIIGVTCGFFLYLGELLVSLGQSSNIYGSVPSGELGSAILPFITPLVFMLIGLIFGLQTSAMGASTVMGLTKKGGKAIGKFAGKKGFSFAKEKMPAGVRKMGEKIATKARWGEGQTGIAGFTKRTVTAPWYHARRGLGRLVSTGLTESQKTETGQAQEKHKGKTAATQLSALHNATSSAEKIGVLQAAIEDGNVDDLMDEKKMGKKGVLKRDEVERLIGEGKKWDSHKKLQRAFPQFAEKSVSDEELAEAKAKDPTIDTKEKLVVSKMKPPDYKNISDGALDDIRVVDAILSKAMGQHISQLIEGKGRQAAEALERQIWEKAEAEGVKPEEYLQKQNPKLHRYLIAGAGRGLIDFTKKPELKPKEEPKKESEEVKEPIPPWGGRKEKKY